MLLSHRILADRDRSIQNRANCDQFYQDLEMLYESYRIIAFYPFVYAFSYDLLHHAGPIERYRDPVAASFRAFREFLAQRFARLREVNDRHSSRPDEHRVYANIINQQWAYLFEPHVYLKPDDLRRQEVTQTRPSDFYKIFRLMTIPFLFEHYFLQNASPNQPFWDDGDSPPDEYASYGHYNYYKRTKAFFRILCLAFVANDELSPYISSIFLCERVVDQNDHRNKSDFQKRMCRYGKTTSVVPIFRIEWDQVRFGFKED